MLIDLQTTYSLLAATQHLKCGHRPVGAARGVASRSQPVRRSRRRLQRLRRRALPLLLARQLHHLRHAPRRRRELGARTCVPLAHLVARAPGAAGWRALRCVRVLGGGRVAVASGAEDAKDEATGAEASKAATGSDNSGDEDDEEESTVAEALKSATGSDKGPEESKSGSEKEIEKLDKLEFKLLKDASEAEKPGIVKRVRKMREKLKAQ